MTEPKYPELTVDLIGQDGNAFMMISRVSGVLRRGKVPADEIKRFQDEATSGDYDNVISTILKWVNVE